MKKLVCFICASILVFGLCVPAMADPVSEGLDIKASSAILMDAKSGRVLYEKDADAKRYPASTTKVLTALLAVENLDPDKIITISETAVDIDRDGSNMGLLKGEEISVRDLLYGLLVDSANDAANALGEEVSGSQEAFAQTMNQRAAELGATGSHFANPHGYHDDNHYTTARDLCLIAREAMKYDLFSQIVSTTKYQIPPTNKYTEVREFSNHNALINPAMGRTYLYSAATGIKTGYTSKAGKCLVASAEKDGAKYVCVVLDAPQTDGINYSFADPITLFDYAFKNYKMQTLSNTEEILATKEVRWASGSEQAVLSSKEPLRALLPVNYEKEKLETALSLPDTVTAPIKAGETVGYLTYSYDGYELGKVELVNKKDIGISYIRMIFGTILSWILSAWVMVPLGIIVVIILILRWNELRRQKKLRERRKNASRRNFYR
ncbi:MAG: D-alanyl-D-alanine carboxypeptidase [Clostridia bacterium]|nr:D-alanyl-D-alanine carboxypeptidase [Clostridia bacterium]